MSHKCLLVTADDGRCHSLNKELILRDIKVVRAADAVMALSAARQHEPDVVALDSRLPGGGGARMIERFRSFMATAVTPVVALTDNLTAERDSLLQAGAQSVCDSGWDPGRVADTIKSEVHVDLQLTMAPAKQIHDPARLQALEESGLLDTAPEEELDRFTRLAAKLLQTPSALISVVDRDRQYFKSEVGLRADLAQARQTPLSHSFCQWPVALKETLAVDEAASHPLVRHNPAIKDYGATAYCGVPLRTVSGHMIGTLCVVDDRPRTWTDDELEALEDLAGVLSDYLASRGPRRDS